MPIIVYCAYCAAKQSVPGVASVEELEMTALAEGWVPDRIGWLCPEHSGTSKEKESAALVLLNDSLRKRRAQV